MSAQKTHLPSLFQTGVTRPVDLVIIIDQDKASSFCASTLLCTSGITRNVINMSDREQAIDYLASVLLSAIPDILFLDTKYLGKTDYNFMEHFSNLPLEVRQKSRIIIISDQYNREERMMALMNPYIIGYMVRPIDLEQFQSRINY